MYRRCSTILRASLLGTHPRGLYFFRAGEDIHAATRWPFSPSWASWGAPVAIAGFAVSYTHLTLPTILLV
eukprot:4908309-Pyramimonas_sp.AAC.1